MQDIPALEQAEVQVAKATLAKQVGELAVDKLVSKSNVMNGMVLACGHEVSKLILSYHHGFGTEFHDNSP